MDTMPDINKNVQIAAPIESIWAALTDPASIEGWMGYDSAVQVNLWEGGRCQFFGGSTTGIFTRIEEPGLLEYTWRQEEWDKDWADSMVHWELAAVGDGTLVSLTHSEFPNAEERDSHDEGWDIYFLGPMKEWLEQNV